MSLLIQWVYTESEFLRYCMYESLDEEIGDYWWLVNLQPKHVPVLVKHRSFWRDVLWAWCSLNYKNPETAEEVYNQSLWLNSDILVAGEVCCNKNAIMVGVRFCKTCF